MTFIELCAGSAAVSLAWLRAGAVPPIGYQGSKRAFAEPILNAFGLAPGGAGPDDRVILVEAGPWGEAWQHWRTPGGRVDTCSRLCAWAAEEPRVLWDRLRRAPVPVDCAERVTVWVALQYWSFRSKPVTVEGGYWRTHGIHLDVDASAYAAGYVAPDGRTWVRRDRRLPDVVRALETLPDLSRVEVVRGDARDAAPIPGAVVYLDPDYQGATDYNSFSLPRADVLAVAERWRRAGCRVAVSEAEPLPLEWPCYVKLPPPRGRGRTWSKQREEWLTVSECAHQKRLTIAEQFGYSIGLNEKETRPCP